MSSPRGSTHGQPESGGFRLHEAEAPAQKRPSLMVEGKPHSRKLSVGFADSFEPTHELKEQQDSRRRRIPSHESNVASRTASISSAGNPSRNGSAGFSFVRRLTSYLYGIPLGFFQSRAELRTWGEEKLTDPSVQPYSQRPMITPFHQTLPGYGKDAVMPLRRELMGKQPGPFYTLAPKGGFVYNPHHPNMDFSRVQIEYPTRTGDFKPPMYEWTSMPEFKMTDRPYTSARLLPANPATMYVSGNYMTAYPYGVPAVEENEGGVRVPPSSRRCRFLC